jgi:hypothetical protein
MDLVITIDNEISDKIQVKRKETKENIKQSFLGKCLMVFVGALTIVAGGAMVYIIVKLIYMAGSVLASLISDNLSAIGLGLGYTAAAVLVIWLIYKLLDCHGKNMANAIRDFFKWCGRGLSWLFKPLLKIRLLAWIVSFFKMLGLGIAMIATMCHAFYKNYCPMITWEEEPAETETETK